MDFFKKNKGNIFRILLLVASVAIIANIFPSERKFRYEIQKNKPWQHENLMAPFDFAIYKLPEEIETEKDSIRNEFKPYFDFNKEIEQEKISLFKQKYDEHWKLFVNMDSVMRESDKDYKKNTPKPDRLKFDSFFLKILEHYTFIYNSGIIEPTDINSPNTENLSVVINKDNFPKTYDYSTVFTQKTAYEFLKKKINEESDQAVAKFFLNMNLNTFLEVNLVYNKKFSEDLKKDALKNMSQTRGFVQAGERIIFKGEVVDEQKYRILVSLKKEYENSVGLSANVYLIIFGHLLLIITILAMLVMFAYNHRPEILQNTRKTILILLLINLFVVVASLSVKYSLVNLYIIPFAILPIIIKVFFDERIALFAHIVTIFIVGFIAPNGFEFILLQFLSGFAAIFTLSTLSRRGQIYISSAGVFVALSVLYLGIALTQEGDLEKIKWINFAYFAGNSILLLTAYPLIFAFEKIFGFISDVTLLEISNTNNPLLQELAQKAPGTFQHSLQVASLAEAAATKISANPLLVRAGALYHDIGKTVSPIFFIENQVAGINPHDSIDFDKSAEIIISHVRNGVEIARKNKLPEQIIDFIRTHHGVTKVQYFYKSYIKKYPDSEVDISKFTYEGPRPFSKETAILMMADSIEAASRSLKNIDKEKINDLVENIINYQMRDNQFINTDITFKEITIIKNLFKQMLQNIYHARIEYPK